MFHKIALIVFSLYTGSSALAMPQPQLQLVFGTQPKSSCSGELAPITVNVVDPSGAIVPASFPITLTVAGRNGILVGTHTVIAVNGSAVFPQLRLDNEFTGVKLQALAREASSAYSNSFNVGQPACKDRFEGLRHATAVSTTRVRLRWNASIDPLVDKYRIYDVTNRNSPVLFQELEASATQTTILALASGHTYYFRVRSVDTSGVEDTNLTDVGIRLCDTARTIPCDSENFSK